MWYNLRKGSTAAQTQQVGRLLELPSLESVAYVDECACVMAVDLTTLSASADSEFRRSICSLAIAAADSNLAEVLHTLALNYVVSAAPSNASLPYFLNLRRLVLSDLAYTSSAVADLLSAVSTPQLHTLILITLLEDPPAASAAVSAELSRLGPPLKILGLHPCIPIQDATWEALQSIDTLVFNETAAFEAISSRRPPSTLRRVVFVPEPGNDVSTSTLLEWAQSFKAFLRPVQVLQVPPMDAASEDERLQREQLLSLCQELEVEIRETRDDLYPSWAEYMDELLNLW